MSRRRSTSRSSRASTSARSTTSRSYYRRSYRRRSKETQRQKLRELSDELLEEIVDAVTSRLGLAIVELSRDELKQIFKPMIEGIMSSYEDGVTKERIVATLVSSSEHVYRVVASWILEHRDKLTPEQLEFVVTYGGPVAAANVSKLYALAKSMGRDDLVQLLRAAWESYGKPTPIECPKCGFRAVTPELYCLVCGHELSDRELREVTGFRERLYEAAKSWSLGEVREAFERGYVYLGYEVKPPSAPRDPMDVEVVLNKEERELLKKILEERQGA